MNTGLGFFNEKFFTVKKNAKLIAESITRIVMTNPGERLNHPFFGVGLKNMLFENFDEFVLDEIKTKIIDQIGQYEPRVSIADIDVTSDYNKIFITIKFNIIEENKEDSLTFEFNI